jgi:hypothetical protein
VRILFRLVDVEAAEHPVVDVDRQGDAWKGVR